MIIPVILCGGSGTRLWPLSRTLYPKQFLPLVSQDSMFVETLKRLEGLENIGDPIIICNEEHRFIAAEQLLQCCKDGGGKASILLEPEGRNTAPALAVAAICAEKKNKDDLLLVLPADHIIKDVDMFLDAVAIAAEAARNGKLATFGVVPTEAHTGYGYIKFKGSEDQVKDVECFVEKPDLDTAVSYFESGDYLWNSGMFLMQASTYLQELEKFSPDMVHACKQAVTNSVEDLDFVRLDRESFLSSPADSIDYAVMEKTDKSVVVPLGAGWNDVGSWSAIWETGSKDSNGNVTNGDVITADSNNCYLYGEQGLVSAVGVNDLIIIQTSDAVLVADKSKSQEVKQIVEKLKRDGRSETSIHKKVSRPWGTYDCVDCDEFGRFQVKRIVVKPGAKLSLQMHYHRAEHWIVVKGTAKITCGEKEFILSENESTYIPIGETHSLENPGQIPLELIEVQSGSYLGEDDIVRFEDRYGREG